MNTSNHFFTTAQVCQNGHLRNSDTSTHAAKAVTYLSQLLATFTAEVSFFDDFPTMRAGRHIFIFHHHHAPQNLLIKYCWPLPVTLVVLLTLT